MWQRSFFCSSPEFGGKILQFRAGIKPVCSKIRFFGLHLSLGGKFRTEIELLSLTKLRKKGLPL